LNHIEARALLLSEFCPNVLQFAVFNVGKASASAANRTSVVDARLGLRCIGSSPLVTRLPTRGVLPAALDSGLHLLSVLQVTFEQWPGTYRSKMRREVSCSRQIPSLPLDSQKIR
jgi:hypothetical protein